MGGQKTGSAQGNIDPFSERKFTHIQESESLQRKTQFPNSLNIRYFLQLSVSIFHYSLLSVCDFCLVSAEVL
jgi:hypothetical protein